MDLVLRAQTEVETRHAFFVDWFTGRAGPAQMDHCATAFAPQMRMIRPDGTILHKADVVELIRRARNCMTGPFDIEIRIRAAETLSPDLALLVYDEYQQLDGLSNLRRSTALMQADSAAPHGVLWRHVQETWLDQQN